MTTPLPTPPALRVDRLEYAYPDGRKALDGVTFSVGAGEAVALVGPNGAGKSTLLLHTNGLLPGRGGAGSGDEVGHAHDLAAAKRAVAAATAKWRATEARVWVDGVEVNERNGPEVRRKVGLLFQDPDDQLFSTTALDDVAFGPLNLGMGKAEAHRLAAECLERVGLGHAAGRPPHRLSFGERKRVCLAGVLACGPTLLVLDEPTANLDPRARRNFITLIRDLPAAKLVATHDLEMVLELCGRSVVLDGGKVVADGPSRAILSDAALLEAHGLEVPLSLALEGGRA